MLLAFETFSLGSVLTKIQILNFYTKVVNFVRINFYNGPFVWNVLRNKFLKVDSTTLIKCRFYFGLSILIKSNLS